MTMTLELTPQYACVRIPAPDNPVLACTIYDAFTTPKHFGDRCCVTAQSQQTTIIGCGPDPDRHVLTGTC